jgi:hypothetical protein
VAFTPTPYGPLPHPAIWQNANAKAYDLGLAPGTTSGYAVAVNNLGVVIGHCQNDSGGPESNNGLIITDFVYINGKMYDLNASLVQNTGYTIAAVSAINDFGVILAQAHRIGDSNTAVGTPPQHTVLLTPVYR